MYRQYETPAVIEAMIQEAKASYDGSPEAHEWIEELEERLRAAYEDQEEG